MPRLLLINETSLLAELGRSFVRRPGFELVAEPSGHAIEERSREGGADLVVAEMQLPDMTGADLCRRLRAGERTSTTPILLIGLPSEREEAEAAGADVFLTTPWSRSQLLSAIRTLFPVPERSAERLAISLKILCGADEAGYVAFTRDLSANGLFIKGASPASLGERLRLRLHLPGEPTVSDLDLDAEVVRRVAPTGEPGKVPGIGVRFLDLPLERRLPLTRFVREHLAA